MKLVKQKTVNRRDFLHLGVTVAAGVTLPQLMTACGGGGDSSSAPTQTFVQPQVLQSVNGLLDVGLTVSYLNTAIGTSDPAVTQNVSLRAYGFLVGRLLFQALLS
jgi:hypothetical protein